MKFRLLVLGLTLAFPLFAQDARDTAFLTARDAFRTGDRNKLERATAQLGNHELASYAENYRLRMGFDQGDSAAIRDFLERNDKSYVAEKLRADWIRWLGKRSTWNEIDREYPKLLAPEPDLTCYSQQARLARDDRSVLDEAEKLWLTQLEPPEACRPVFDAAVAAQRLSTDDVWTRVRRQVEANRPGQAKTTLNYLPDSQIPDMRAFDSALNNAWAISSGKPGNWHTTGQGANWRPSPSNALPLTIRGSRPSSWKTAGPPAGIRDALAWGQIGLQAAKKHLPEAVVWFAKADKLALSDDALPVESARRAARPDWGVVRDTIQAIPPALAALPEWVYWLGRSLKAGGRTPRPARAVRQNCRQASFYGNLADDELDRTVLPPPKATPPSAEEQKAARDNPASARPDAPPARMRTEGVKNGIGRSAAWTTASCWRSPTSPGATKSGTAPSNTPTGPRTNTTKPCVSSPPTANRSVRPPSISPSTMPGSMA